MDTSSIFSATDKVSRDVTEYVEMRIAASKLAAVEGMSTVCGNAIRIFVFALFCFLALLGLLIAGTILVADLIGSVAWAAVIMGAVCLLIGVLLYFSKKLFINPMVRMFSRMMFSSQKKDSDE